MVQRLATLQTQFDAAEAAADQDFELIAALGLKLEALQLESAQLPLSEEDYRTLPARHAQLVQRVVARCDALAAAGEYAALETLGDALETLQALVLPAAAATAITITGPSGKPPCG